MIFGAKFMIFLRHSKLGRGKVYGFLEEYSPLGTPSVVVADVWELLVTAGGGAHCGPPALAFAQHERQLRQLRASSPNVRWKKHRPPVGAE